MSDDQHVNKALTDLKYMRQLRLLLDALAAWPHQVFDEKKKEPWLRRALINVICFFAFVLGTTYMFTHMKTLGFFELGSMYISILLTAVTLQRSFMAYGKYFVEVTRDFILEIHLLHHRINDEYASKVHTRVHRICSIYTNYVLVELVAGAVLFNSTPMYNNYKAGMYSLDRPANGTYELAVYFELPFDYVTDTRGYIIIYIVNWIMTCNVGFFFCVFDLYLFIIVFHIWGHLKILENDLTSFFRPKSNDSEIDGKGTPWYTDEENLEVAILLKQKVDYHRTIKQSMDLVGTAFGPMMCIYHAFHLVSCCILLLECSRLEATSVGKFGVVTIIIFQQLVQISVVVELLGSQKIFYAACNTRMCQYQAMMTAARKNSILRKSETLKHAVYSLPWECMNISNRKIVLFFLNNVQEPLTLKAMGVVPIGVQTMLAILKTSFSYFMLLRTFTMEY